MSEPHQGAQKVGFIVSDNCIATFSLFIFPASQIWNTILLLNYKHILWKVIR